MAKPLKIDLEFGSQVCIISGELIASPQVKQCLSHNFNLMGTKLGQWAVDATNLKLNSDGISLWAQEEAKLPDGVTFSYVSSHLSVALGVESSSQPQLGRPIVIQKLIQSLLDDRSTTDDW